MLFVFLNFDYKRLKIIYTSVISYLRLMIIIVIYLLS